MTTATAQNITWVYTDNGRWNEWQFSPYQNAYHFVGNVGGDRIQYALERMADGQNPNA